MSVLSDWVQTNWYDLGSLLVQTAILAALVWYGRKTLKTIGASQQQMETLLSLSLAPGARVPAPSEPAEIAGHRVAESWHKLVAWLQAPMGSDAVTPWRRAVRWLQAPVRS